MSYRQLARLLFVSISLGLSILAPANVAGPLDQAEGGRPNSTVGDGTTPEGTTPGATLIVPAAKRSIQLTVPLPMVESASRRGSSAVGQLSSAADTVPAQIGIAVAQDGSADPGQRLLMANLPAGQSTNGTCRYQLTAEPTAPTTTPFQLVDIGATGLQIRDSGRPVLVYNHGVVTGKAVPKSDARRQRACYIHPLWDLDGQVLTDDFPKDHYHHHGIFWAWPHVGIDGKQYDLWMYGNIQQRFVSWLDRTPGPVAAVLGVENGWFIGDRKVMIERLWLRVFQAEANARAIDITLVLIPVGKPVTLWGAAGKSYGGLTVRVAPRPRGDTSITVPTGRTTNDLLNTPLAWADLTAPFGGQAKLSGIALFVDPRNPDFPHAWLTRHYGALCIGWPGVERQTLPAGQPVRLDYRVWVHRGSVDRDALEASYQAYEAAAQARCESLSLQPQ